MRLSLPFLLLSYSLALGQSIVLNGSTGLNGSVVLNPAPPPGPVITNTTAGLVNWWKFDENMGTSAADSADSANASFGVTPPTWTSGIINSALSFNGAATSPVQLSTNTGAGSGAFSVTLWVNVGSVGVDSTPIYDSDSDTTAGFWLLCADDHISLNVVASSNDLNRFGFTDMHSIWTFVAATWSGTITDHTSIHLYTNCVETTEQTFSDGSGTHLANTSSTRYIGHHDSGPPPGDLTAILDDIRIYNRVLSAGEITNIYQWRGEP